MVTVNVRLSEIIFVVSTCSTQPNAAAVLSVTTHLTRCPLPVAISQEKGGDRRMYYRSPRDGQEREMDAVALLANPNSEKHIVKSTIRRIISPQ